MAVQSVSDPTKHPKWLFWLILGMMSLFFAEVVTGSHIWGVFSIWGVISVLPLYGLHAIILMALTHRHGTPKIAAMVSAGAVFGLYEAYITKVIWDPTFPTLGIKFAGLDVGATVWVLLAYHPLMSFIIPVTVADMLCLNSGQWRLWTPNLLRRALLNPRRAMGTVALLGVIAGVFNACTIPPTISHNVVAMMMMLNSAFIALLVWMWNRHTRGELTSLAAALPNRKQLVGLGYGLLAVFLIHGCLLRLGSLPSLKYQVGVWLLYALFIWLFWRGSRKEAVCEPPDRKHVLFQQAPLVCLLFGVSISVGTILGDKLHPGLKGIYLIISVVWMVAWSWWMYAKAFRLARGAVSIHRQ